MRSARLAVRARAVASSRRPSVASGRWSPRSTFEPGRCAWRRARSCMARRYATRWRSLGGVSATSSMRLPNGSSTNARASPAGRRRAALGSRRRRAREQRRERRGVAQAERGVGLRRGRERLADAHVELLSRRTRTSSRRAPPAQRASRARADRAGRRRTCAPAPRSRREPPPARDRCRRRPAHSTTALRRSMQHHVPPGLAELAQALARADDAEAAALVQRDARRVLGEDPRLQRPDAAALGALDERAQQAASDALAARLLGDVDRLPGHPPVDGTSPRTGASAAQPTTTPSASAHQPAAGQVRLVPGGIVRHRGLEGGVARCDALGVDRGHGRPVARAHRRDPETRTAPARAGAVRGTAYGIRTRVTGVRGQRPRPLDERGTYSGRRTILSNRAPSLTRRRTCRSRRRSTSAP